jgi:hypothetical protein
MVASPLGFFDRCVVGSNDRPCNLSPAGAPRQYRESQAPVYYKAFEEFLSGAPHKAFAMSATGAYGWNFGRRTIEAAKSGALANCPSTTAECRVIVIDDTAVP